jgi:hypothetical protein
MACDPKELRHVPLFALLDDDEAAVLAAQVELKSFAPRQRIYKMGDRCRRSFVLPTLPSLLKLQVAVQLGEVPCLTYTARLRVVRVRRRR